MIISDLPTRCKKPLRVLGIDLGTTKSILTEIKWQPGSPSETRVIQIEQDTPETVFSCLVATLMPLKSSAFHNATIVKTGTPKMKHRNPYYIMST